MSTLLVTGSSGLIGSEVCRTFHGLGWDVHGVDNNQRAEFFGARGDTSWNRCLLERELSRFTHHDVDVRDREGLDRIVAEVRPDAVVHAAAQPSHDLAARLPFADFDVNATGTLNLLEATRRHARDAPFVHLSTNKVYGDSPNRIPLEEQETRYDFAPPHEAGIAEDHPIDRSTHSLFGASKLAADILVQEYGRYFDMPTCSLRAGCLTGPSHSGVELHGFLSHLIRCNVAGEVYTIFGYEGKQVRDNLHAVDVASFAHAFIHRPRAGEVYNLGGGRANSCSILEAFVRAQKVSGKEMRYRYSPEARVGDHICYISDLSKARRHYPEWAPSRSLDDMFEEIHRAWVERLQPSGGGSDHAESGE